MDGVCGRRVLAIIAATKTAAVFKFPDSDSNAV